MGCFEAKLPALDSGKYDFGASNFGVTDERRKTIDFVTYINDGQGFATRKDSGLSMVTDQKWATTGSAITKSQISPPELRN